MADSLHLFTLLEIAAGYTLFEVVAFEEIGALLSGSMDTVTDLALFSRAVKLKAFQPFASAEDALENANAISEHAMTASLQSFLEMNLPRVSKKSSKEGKSASFSLGILDPGLATAVSEGIPGISVRSDDTVREILRGCRLHLKHYVKGLEGNVAEQAQLGLGHAYSRGKVKFNPARSDNMIIQSIALLDQMDKDLNTFAMRIREWYSWHFPELKDLVKDNYMFARCAAFIQDKASLFPPAGESTAEDDDDKNGSNGLSGYTDKLPGLIEIVGDAETASSVIAAAKTSMGMSCSAIDMINIVNFTQRMVKLAEYRKQLAAYLTDKMSIVAPNLSALIGDVVGARLISKAGSLTNLAKAPASTVQILGAEKALFRALKTKGNTPKYGLIYHSTFIGRANAKNKGRISRYLANKCAIATRIDSFSDEPTNIYGEKLREQVEERLKFYETGAAPRKNLDVMTEVARQLAVAKSDVKDAEMKDAEKETPKKKDKKDKKRKREEVKEEKGIDKRTKADKANELKQESSAKIEVKKEELNKGSKKESKKDSASKESSKKVEQKEEDLIKDSSKKESKKEESRKKLSINEGAKKSDSKPDKDSVNVSSNDNLKTEGIKKSGSKDVGAKETQKREESPTEDKSSKNKSEKKKKKDKK